MHAPCRFTGAPSEKFLAFFGLGISEVLIQRLTSRRSQSDLNVKAKSLTAITLLRPRWYTLCVAGSPPLRTSEGFVSFCLVARRMNRRCRTKTLIRFYAPLSADGIVFVLVRNGRMSRPAENCGLMISRETFGWTAWARARLLCADKDVTASD